MRLLACLAIAVISLMITATPSTAQPSEQQLAEHLRQDRVYNAPGREDPVDPRVIEEHADSGLRLRIAAFPPGAPDYTRSLAEVFPDEVILVARGNDLDVAAPYQAQAESAVEHARAGGSINQRIGDVVDRLGALVRATDFGAPQPSWTPPFVDRVIAVLVPVSLVGTAVAISVTVLLSRRRRAVPSESRRASGLARAKIGRLGAELLVADEREPHLADAAERYDTARRLHDEARTADAMGEVAKTADEGLRYLRHVATEPGPGVSRQDPTPESGLFVAAGLLAGFGAVLLVILVGLVGSVIEGDEERTEWSDQTEAIIDGLQHSPVHDLTASADDLDGVREVVGDRPMVVILFDEDPPRPLSCREIAAIRTTDLVILFGAGVDVDLCLGPDYFTPARPGVHPEYATLWTEVRDTRAWRAGDRLGVLRELVFAYDVQAVADHRPDKVPSRALVAPAPQSGRGMDVLVILVGPTATAVLYGIFRRSGRLLVRRGARHQAAGTRLNRLADAVLHPPEPTDAEDAAHQADLAERYVLLLRDYETADIARVEQRLDELEQEVTR